MKTNIATILEPKANTIKLSAPIEVTDEFTYAVNYAKKALGLRGNTLLAIAGVKQLQDCVANPTYLMKHTNSDARVGLSYLLVLLGYSLEQIFDEVLVFDFPFRHTPIHKQWSKHKYRDKKKIERLWCASEALRLTKQSRRLNTLEAGATEYISKHPETPYTAEQLTRYIRTYYSIDELRLNLTKNFGSWFPLVSTIRTRGTRPSVVCRCVKCGHTRQQQAFDLLNGKWIKCEGCKRIVRERRIKRQIASRSHQFVVDVLTGMRMKTTAEVHRKYNLDETICLHTFRERLHTDQYIKVGKHCFMLMSLDRLGHRTYQRFLAPLGLPEDYKIPSPPDWFERLHATRKKTMAKRETAYYRRRLQLKKQRKIKTASLETQEAGYWNRANIQEYRELREEKHEETLAKVMAEDEFYFPQMKQ